MEKNENDFIQIDDIQLEDITDDDIIEIDLFGDSSSEEHQDFDIKMIVDNDKEFSLVEESLVKMDNNDDRHLKLAAMIGIDLSSGKTSKSLESDLSNILIDMEVAEEDEESEVTTETHVEISKEFDENEIQRHKDNLIGIMAFHKDLEIGDRFKLYMKKLEENNKTKNSLLTEKRKVEKESEPEIKIYERLEYVFSLYKKIDTNQPISKKEKEMLLNLNRKEAYLMFKQKKVVIRRFHEKLVELLDSIEVCDKVEEELMKEVKELKEFRANSSLEEIKSDVERIINNTKKIVQIQYGVNLYSSEFKELPVAIKCACGHKDVYSVTDLPYYISGNIYDNFRERSYIDKDVKKNLYSNRDTVKSRETRTKLQRESNMIESRIHFPGLTDGEGEPLKCKGCSSYLSFTPDTVDKLSERGFTLDVLTAELSATSTGKKLDLSEGVKLFLNKTEIDSKYMADLGLSEYKMSKISSNIKDIDGISQTVKLGTKNRIDENSLRIYAGKPTGEVNLKQIEEELRGHIKNINMAIDDMTKKYRTPKMKQGLTGSALVKYENKKRKNEGINRFLHNSRSIILKYAIDNRISSQGLKSIIKANEDNIGKFKSEILKFLIEYLIESVIEGRPTFVFEEGYARTIDNKKMVLPHTNFFNCYKPLIQRYFLSGKLSKVKKDFELIEHYKLFRSLSNISKIEDYKTRVKTSEEFVKKFRSMLDNDFENSRSQLIDNVNKVNSIIDEKERLRKAETFLKSVKSLFTSSLTNTDKVEELINSHFSIENETTRNRKTEEFISTINKELQSNYDLTKSRLFFDYIKDTVKFESNLDASGKCFGWLYYEMITQDRVIKQTEVMDQELFEKLYGEELREKGHFYIFQLDNSNL